MSEFVPVPTILLARHCDTTLTSRANLVGKKWGGPNSDACEPSRGKMTGLGTQ